MVTSFEFLAVSALSPAAFHCQLNRQRESRDPGGPDRTLVCIQPTPSAQAVPSPTKPLPKKWAKITPTATWRPQWDSKPHSRYMSYGASLRWKNPPRGLCYHPRVGPYRSRAVSPTFKIERIAASQRYRSTACLEWLSLLKQQS